MVQLMKLIKAVVVAALLNETVKRALAAKLMKSINGLMQPSASYAKGVNQHSHLRTLLEVALALLLTKSKKGGWKTEPMAISTIAALLADLMRSVERPHEQKSRVIDIDDYTVVDER